jgi:hypothetical protein
MGQYLDECPVAARAPAHRTVDCDSLQVKHLIAVDDVQINDLARMLHEGNEVQGNYGKQGWLIGRQFIALATYQGGSAELIPRKN